MSGSSSSVSSSGSAQLLLWQRIARSGASDGKFKAIDIAKAKCCGKFVGYGAKGSYTAHYAVAAAELANCGWYVATDWVMVSTNGKREDRYSPVDSNGQLRGVYGSELRLAAAAGATLVADTLPARSNGYNIGEEELAIALREELGCEEHPPESGIWQRRRSLLDSRL